MCLAGSVPTYAPQDDICLGFFRAFFFFFNTVNLYSACDLQKNADLSRESCHLTRLKTVPCCISVPTGCGKGMCHKEEANFLDLR